MNKKIWNNPYNLMGKFISLSTAKQHILLSVIMMFFIYLPFNNYLSKNQEIILLKEDIVLKQKQIVHQQKLLYALQNITDNKLLTPKLTSHISTVNNQLKRLLPTKLNIHSTHWEYQKKPILTLNMKGYFTDINQLISDLFNENKNIDLLFIKINKNNDDNDDISVESEISLQLNITEN
ncbi:hypothetical protein ACFQ02_06580 [Seminibacterium arietis]|uniref:Type II secretion system (T2SS), protein M n=1 Tax=Seminibacterium arietis TaxID=1173502 RepID=A0ABW3IA26_9PAST